MAAPKRRTSLAQLPNAYAVDQWANGTLPMASRQDFDRRNDMRLLTPLLLMATLLAFGILAFALTGHALAAG
jgi:hypothetical protein